MPHASSDWIRLENYVPTTQQGVGDCQTAVAMSIVNYFSSRLSDYRTPNRASYDRYEAFAERRERLLKNAAIERPDEFRKQVLEHHMRKLSPHDPLPFFAFGRLVSPIDVIYRHHGQHTGYPPSISSIKEQLEQERPIVIVLKPTLRNLPFHFVTLIGWCQLTQNGRRCDFALIHDPLPDTLAAYRIDQHVSVAEQEAVKEPDKIVYAPNELSAEVQRELRSTGDFNSISCLRLIPSEHLYKSSESMAHPDFPHAAEEHLDHIDRTRFVWASSITFKPLWEPEPCGPPEMTPPSPDDESQVKKFSFPPLTPDDSRESLAGLIWGSSDKLARDLNPLVKKGRNDRFGFRDNVGFFVLPTITTNASDNEEITSSLHSWGEWICQPNHVNWQDGYKLLQVFTFVLEDGIKRATPYSFRLTLDEQNELVEVPQLRRTVFGKSVSHYLVQHLDCASSSLLLMHSETGRSLLLNYTVELRAPDTDKSEDSGTVELRNSDTVTFGDSDSVEQLPHQKLRRWCEKYQRNYWNAYAFSEEPSSEDRSDATAGFTVLDIAKLPSPFFEGPQGLDSA